jgi:SAM-dependent methyltransferase
MLDAGAGDSPYRKLFAHAQYEAADICKRDAHQYSHVQYVCDLTAIPVADARFDLVLCTQVLEHVPEPRKVLGELRRVLKPGGALWISAPLSFHEHEVPHDYFRYTQYGWARMIADAGLELVTIEWLQGYLGTVAYQMNQARHYLPASARDYGGGVQGMLASAFSLLMRPILLGAAFIYSRLDMRHRYTTRGHPLDYCVVARRPAG